jgi:pimeloyl-ACP methyl ester carboxylesterase
LLTAWLASNRPDLVKAIVLEDPPLFSSEYPEVKQTVAFRLFKASYDAVNNPNYSGNFLDYWVDNGKDFFRTYAGPLAQPIVKLLVGQFRKANPDQPVEIAFMPPMVQEMLRGLDMYDPQFGLSFYEGKWNEGFDHADAISKIECPVLLIQAGTGYLDDGTLNGAMSQEMAERVVSLIPNCEYVEVDAGHVTNLEIPERFVTLLETFFLK